MKNRVLLAFALVVLAGCTVEQTNDVVEVRPVSDVFSATIENPDTKVYVDGDLKTHWNEGDEISIFTTTYNQHFKFDGQTGDDEGTFTELSNQFFTGGEVPTVYAVYPYNENTSVTSEGVITLTLPAVQNYAENSFGIGANTMVAATENKSARALKFKSVCGYVVVRLYGDATIKSVTLTGNNGEKVSGQATVAPMYGQAPAVVMSESAGTSIVLDCGEGVELGKTPEEATAFWFAVPPVTFTQGFTIRVTNTDGYSMEKSTHAERTVVRNVKNPLSALAVAEFPVAPEGNIVFEDANFKAYCVQNFDKDGDGEVSYAEGLRVTTIKVNTDNITSMVGIEHFIHLDSLTCLASRHPNYDNGYAIQIGDGKLKSLDISNNTALTYLKCINNQLSDLDISKNVALRYLNCDSNKLASLDVSNNYALTSLMCNYNQFTTLDVSNLIQLRVLRCYRGALSSLNTSGCVSLTELRCDYNQLTSLDTRGCIALPKLVCSFNQLASLNVSGCPSLETIECDNNQFTELDLSECTALISLRCDSNPVTSLNVSGCSALTGLKCGSNKLTSLDVSQNPALSYLDCGRNQLISLDVSHNAALTSLRCSSNQLTSLDVSQNPELLYLHFSSNHLAFIDISNNNKLSELICDSNQLTSLDISFNTRLHTLHCESNQLSFLDVTLCKELSDLNCSRNGITVLNLTQSYALQQLHCDDNRFGILDVSSSPALWYLSCMGNPSLIEIWLHYGQTISELYYDSSVTTLKNKGNTENVVIFEDAYFKVYCLQNFDKDKDGEISFAEAETVNKIDINSKAIQSLQGIQHFTSLDSLICRGNLLSSLDVSKNTSLSYLKCNANPLVFLDVSRNTALAYLNCANCYIATLDVSNNTELKALYCYYNQLTSLDVSHNTALTTLKCTSNPYLTEIWLKTGQTISTFEYDTDIATIKYKD